MKNMKNCSTVFLVLCFVLIVTGYCFLVEANPDNNNNTCKPSGKIRGKKPPPACNGDDNDCCKEGQLYDVYNCSPQVSNQTKAFMTLNVYGNVDGGAPSECDGMFHSDKELVVALSTGWFSNKKRCLEFINIYGNGKTVKAKVVDECDTTMGCDTKHDYKPPCDNNVVDASEAVWEALGVPKDSNQWGAMEIYWSDIHA